MQILQVKLKLVMCWKQYIGFNVKVELFVATVWQIPCHGGFYFIKPNVVMLVFPVYFDYAKRYVLNFTHVSDPFSFTGFAPQE